MKILVAAVSGDRSPAGVSRHAMNMTRSLLMRDEVSRVDLVVGKWQMEYFGEALAGCDSRLVLRAAEVEGSSIKRNLWYRWALPKLAAELKCDVLQLAFPVPIGKKVFSCPTVVTLHDFYPFDLPSNFGYPKVFLNQLFLLLCLRRADAIACVSDSTLHRLHSSESAAVRTKARRIYNCVNPPGPVSTASPLPDWNGEPFLLCVAQHRRNKNIPLALRAFDDLIRRSPQSASMLIIVGCEGPETAMLHGLVAELGLTEQVMFLHGISDPELQWCYENCELLLAPSTIEGFGLPIIEALQSGCRVVCSDIPITREIGGEFCHYFSLAAQGTKALLGAIEQALASPRGIAVSTDKFSEQEVGSNYWKLYGQLLRNNDAPYVGAGAPLELGRGLSAAAGHDGENS